MAYINGKKVLSVNRTNYVSETERDLKARYHLGAYDSVSTSGGITTITRKTGYIDLGSLEWIYITDGAYPIFLSNAIYNILSINNEMDMSKVVCAKYTTINAMGGTSFKNSDYNKKITQRSYQKDIMIQDSNYTSASAFKIAMQGVMLQYELATIYEEQVIEGQPLNTLDQNESQIVKEEVDKGLNLLQENITNSTYNIILGYVKLKANTTYNLWVNNELPIGQGARLQDENGNVIAFNNYTFRKNSNFTLSSDYEGVIKLNGTFTGITPITNAMVVKCNHAYPYVPYYGKIVREGYGHVALTTSGDVPPTTDGDWEFLGYVDGLASGDAAAWRKL